MTEVKEILVERGKVHGDFSENARFSRMLKEVAYTSNNIKDMTVFEKEALDMILHKISRILAGNPHYKDHWDDIAGYAILVSQRLK